MKNNNFNLQVLHHGEVFETREAAIQFLEDEYQPRSLEAEPVIVKYGDERNPNAILAFGTSDASPRGSFYAIDFAKAEEQIDTLIEEIGGSQEELENIAELLEGVVNATGLTVDDNKINDKVGYEPDSSDNVIGTAETIAQAVDLLSKYVQSQLADNELSVENTESVNLIYEVNPNGGKLLKAKVNISTSGDSDDLNFNNNIIGIKNDGIYAASNLAYDDARHQLIFTTSGYKNGRFQDDAIVQRVDLGEHTKLVADNDGKTVKLVITENPSTYTSTISAELQIADRENNILKVADGKVYVEGLAKNIKYADTNVAAALNDQKSRLNTLETDVQNAAKSAHIEGGQTDTLETVVSTLADGGASVTGNVRLGSTNSIVVRNGGLEANITVDVDTATNKLIVTIGNETIVKTLPGVELFESAEYNDENEELIITFKTGNVIHIPIHGIIHTWEVLNPTTSPVTLTKTVVTGGVDTLSGDIKLRSTDNLISKENGQLFVSESNINNKVSTETTRATAAEQALGTRIDTLTTNVSDQISGVEDSITDVRDALTAETARAREAENAISATANHADEVAAEAKETVTELNSTVATLSSDLSTLETKVENIEGSVEEIAVLRTNLNNEITNRTNKDTELQGLITAANAAIETETSRATTAEETITARIAHDISDVNGAITAEQTRATAAEQANTARIDELDEKIGAGSEQTLADAKAYTDTKVTDEKTTREAKDVELQSEIDALATALENSKFVTSETDTVRMTLAEGAETKTLSSDVKIKTLSGDAANIIKSDANGIYATVTFEYDKATNKITFNDGNGNKVFELNNFGILQDAFYDSENKSIVLIVKKDDETTERITIPVADLVNTWTVENDANSPVVLTKAAGDEGDVLSAEISILNNENNLLVNDNGSLFVDGDSNAHKALWGNEVTSVQGVINILFGVYNDIQEMKQDIADLQEDNENIKATLSDLEDDLEDQKERITANENNITALTERVDNLTETVNTFDERITEAQNNASEAIEKVNTLIENIGDGSELMQRIERIEQVLEQLIDFGEYDIQL